MEFVRANAERIAQEQDLQIEFIRKSELRKESKKDRDTGKSSGYCLYYFSNGSLRYIQAIIQ